MIDKSKWKTVVEQHGTITAAHFTGGGECLWLDMYLDAEHGNMVCTSDIGEYSYHFGKHIDPEESFIAFCIRWLSNDEWILRKCCGEKNKMQFNAKRTECVLRDDVETWYGDEEYSKYELDEILEAADGYADRPDGWFATVYAKAEELEFELPEEWYECGVYEYSAWQKRFAEICRESIVPELRKLQEQGAGK